MSDTREIQLIANLVVLDSGGRHVLLARYNFAGERADDADDDLKWWLPAHELDPYQHPDEAAQQALDAIGGLAITELNMVRVQSFRGRRGWHISFDYHAIADGQPGGAVPASWHPILSLPPTMHGNWEKETIHAVSGLV